MTIPTTSLVMHEADSARVLRAALESWVRLQGSLATYHDETGRIRRAAGDASEGARHKRQAAEYRRRQALAQQLVDQLPATTTKAPK